LCGGAPMAVIRGGIQKCRDPACTHPKTYHNARLSLRSAVTTTGQSAAKENSDSEPSHAATTASAITLRFPIAITTMRLESCHRHRRLEKSAPRLGMFNRKRQSSLGEWHQKLQTHRVAWLAAVAPARPPRAVGRAPPPPPAPPAAQHVVGRDHASLLANLEAWHSEPFTLS
jgi:hypothetical protein